jgi:branched-subunit amino acid aminotransferase/4-amino-4-deoxychorismate lyase
LVSGVWLDGNKVSSIDWILAGGTGFFAGVRAMTTMLAIGNRAIDFDRHIARLLEHSTRMGMGEGPSPDLLRFDVETSLVGVFDYEWSRLRIVLFKDDNGTHHRLVSVASESTADIRLLKEKGLKLNLFRDPSWPRGAHVKTGFSGTRHIQVERAKSSGFDDVLWINGDGEIAEATWSNLFLIGRTGDLVEIATPPASSGILEGVTRRRITELLVSAKIPVTERVITEEEIPGFDEAFVTSSIRGLVAVTQIGSHRLHTLRPNSVFGHISRLYQTWLGIEHPSDSSGLPVN